jgi:hypothetical protein
VNQGLLELDISLLIPLVIGSNLIDDDDISKLASAFKNNKTLKELKSCSNCNEV